MLPLRQSSFNRRHHRRHLLVLLLAMGAFNVATGEEPAKLVPLTAPTTTLKIRTSTRPWDDSKPETFQPALRFRPPVAGGNALVPADQTLEANQNTVVGAAASDEWMTSDNWVARDAVNLKQPLRDPGVAPPATVKPQIDVPRAAETTKATPAVPSAPSQPKSTTAPTSTKPTPAVPSAPPPKPTPPKAIASKPTQVPSATLARPIAKPAALPAATPAPSQRAEKESANSLQLVQPSELGALKEIGSAGIAPLSAAPTRQPQTMSVGDLPQAATNRKPSTAVEALLEPSLNAPAQNDVPDRSVANPKESSVSMPKSMKVDELEKDSIEPDGTRGEMQLRRLRIERDGSPTDPQAKNESVSQTPSKSASGSKPGTSRRAVEGDNEPIQEDQRAAAPDLDEEATSRLNSVPKSERGVAQKQLQPAALDYTGRPLPRMQVSTTVRRMQPTIQSCLSYYHAHPDDAAARSNWGMMHQIMVYLADTNITTGKQTYNAIAWIAGNNACRGQRILGTGPRGIEAKSGVGLQGHQGQLLAVLALCSVPDSYPLYVGRERFAIKDLVREEMATCKSGEELTFTLIGLSHYLSTDQQWRSADGQTWDFERLIREELSQPVVGSACGGTHRLMGFAHALRHRRAEGGEISGQWLRAEKFLEDFVKYTYQLQNRDGSMSTSWFEEPQDNGDMDRKVQTTGHMVEWLLTVTPDEDLQNPRLVAAVRFLLGAMNSERGHDWQIGPKGHALRSLAMYYDRVYREGSAWTNSAAMARTTTNSRR